MNTEIGTAVTSSADLVNNQFTISARGIDIGGNSDTFDFVNQLFSGDVELIAKVESFGTATAAPKAGLMIRETLTTGSKKTISEVDNLQTLKQLTHNSRIPRNLLFSPEITDVFL